LVTSKEEKCGEEDVEDSQMERKLFQSKLCDNEGITCLYKHVYINWKIREMFGCCLNPFKQNHYKKMKSLDFV